MLWNVWLMCNVHSFKMFDWCEVHNFGIFDWCEVRSLFNYFLCLSVSRLSKMKMRSCHAALFFHFVRNFSLNSTKPLPVVLLLKLDNIMKGQSKICPFWLSNISGSWQPHEAQHKFNGKSNLALNLRKM